MTNNSSDRSQRRDRHSSNDTVAARKARQKSKGGTKRDIIARIKSLYATFFIIGIVVVVRLVWVTWFSPAVKHNSGVMEEGIYRTRNIEAHHGAILSRDGEPLAISSLRYDVVLDFRSEGMREADSMAYITNVDSLSRLLARHFSKEDAALHGYDYISAEEYRRRLINKHNEARDRGYRVMPRIVTVDEWNMMQRTFPIFDGNMGYVFNAIPEEKRLYPSGDLARQVIGRHDTLVVNNKKVAGTGIELVYHNELNGKDGRVKEQRIAHGFWTSVRDPKNRPVENGCNVITTIDAGLQRLAHERLDTMLRRQHASFGVAMVMEVATGNMLCMVSLGTAAERGTTYSERANNHAVNTKMCPGSTMKLATAMALLEIGGYTLDTEVNTEHSRPRHPVRIGAARVEDSHDASEGNDDGNVTLKDAFAHSSNVYFAKAVYEGFKDKPEEYTNFLAKLGFTGDVGLSKYGEPKGAMKLAGTPAWNTDGSTQSRLPRLAYGYELEVPPIHMLAFYNGVANDGKMVAPRLVECIERDGEVIRRMPVVTLINKMCSNKTLAQLDTCLAAASLRTGSKFRDLEIPFGCKTGTAQVWSTFVSQSTVDHYHMRNGLTPSDDNYYYGSIICTMPQERPKYTIMVAVCKQKTSTHPTYYGIDLAGPVAADIMEYIYDNDPSLHATIESPETPYSPTTIKAGDTKYVTEVSRALTPKTTNKSEGGKWSRAAIDDTGHSTLTAVNITEGLVPDVRGMGLTDALYLLESAGMRVTHTGSGRVKTQSILAGTKITAKTMNIELTLGR